MKITGTITITLPKKKIGETSITIGIEGMAEDKLSVAAGTVAALVASALDEIPGGEAAALAKELEQAKRDLAKLSEASNRGGPMPRTPEDLIAPRKAPKSAPKQSGRVS